MVSAANEAAPDTEGSDSQRFQLFDNNAGKGISIQEWRIFSAERPIANSIREEELRLQLGIKLPSMLFDESVVQITHSGTRFKLLFTAIDALKMVGEADPNIKVRAAEKWMSKGNRNDVEITTIEHASDWTFSTEYAGTLTKPDLDLSRTSDMGAIDYSDRQLSAIDYNALRDTTLPILFSSEVVLFEDELDDNGIASLRVRLRVMPTFFFVLARFFLRVDGVIIRIYDTRYFHRFGIDFVVREINHRQSNLTTSLKHIHPSVLRDPDMAAPHVPIVHNKLDNIPI